MQKKLRCWWWQLLLAAPFLPWLVIHYADWTYVTAKDGLGWDWQAAGFATVVLTLAMLAILVLVFVRAHSKEEW